MKKILTKILEEINKKEPRLDYIRGLIEASLEEDNTSTRILSRDEEAVEVLKNGFTTTYVPKEEPVDDASLLDAKAKASIETIKALSEQSQSQ